MVSLWQLCTLHLPRCTRHLFTEELCTNLLALRTRPFSGKVQKFHSYCTQIYRAVFVLLKEGQNAARAADRIFCNVLETQIPGSGSKKMATIQEFIVGALQALYRANKDNKVTAETCPRRPRLQTTIGIGISSPENTPQPSSSASLASIFFPPPLSGRTFLHRYAPVVHPIPVPVVEVSSEDDIETQKISRMIMFQSDSERDDVPRPGNKMNITRKEHSGARKQSPAPQETLSSRRALQAHVCEKCPSREIAEADSHSDQKSYFWSLEMDTTKEKPSIFPGSDRDELSLDCSAGSHQVVNSRKYPSGLGEALD